MKVERKRVYHPSGGEMLTKQSEKDATDVNLIMDSWIHAGAAVGSHMNPNPPSYGDFSSGIDYHEALNRVKSAEASFMALPAKIRGHVENDPGQFLDMCFDSERRKELEDLGLVERQVPVVADPVVEEPRVESPPVVKVSGEERPGKDPAGEKREAGGNLPFPPTPAEVFD